MNGDVRTDAATLGDRWRLLGLSGLVPFVALAIAVRTMDAASAVIARDLLLGYGALILSFIGGSWWARALDPAADRGARLAVLAMLPTLGAWAALMVAGAGGLLLLAAGLVAALAVDARGVVAAADPRAYLRLRSWLTVVAVAALLAAVPGA